jgi:oligopeptide transport system ATP-binding protein
LHPYTKALLSAVPIPNPKLEKQKQTIIYEPEKSHYDYLVHSPRWRKFSEDHYVFANPREMTEYRRNSRRSK